MKRRRYKHLYFSVLQTVVAETEQIKLALELTDVEQQLNLLKYQHILETSRNWNDGG